MPDLIRHKFVGHKCPTNLLKPLQNLKCNKIFTSVIPAQAGILFDIRKLM